MTTCTGSGDLTLTDVVTNRGAEPLAASMLYHVNVGAPVWSPGARLEVPGRASTVPRNADAQAALEGWDLAPTPAPDARERAFEHLFDDAAERRDVRIVNTTLRVAGAVSWSAGSMPRLHQSVHPRSGVYVLGVEPSNCLLLGRGGDRAAGRLPVLSSEESRTTSLHLTAEQLP